MASTRLLSIDRLRGIVIALMVLDHARDFFSPTPFWPDDLPGTTPGFFFTRWLTHFCAPVFVLLAGTSAFLREQKVGKPRQSWYLFSRGLMLVLLELTVINYSWQLSFGFIFVQVIWALGVSMMVLAVLIHLPRWLIALFAFSQMLLHNAFDAFQQPSWGTWWNVLHLPGYWQLNDTGFGIYFAYPLIPWLGVMAAGYLLGTWYVEDTAARQQKLLRTGWSLLGAFVLLRVVNNYGDAQPWLPQPDGFVYTLMHMLDATKYPPSLIYLCMTLGPAFIALRYLEREKLWLDSSWLRFGRHPLFVYVVHVPIINLLSSAYLTWLYGSSPNMFTNPPFYPPGYEYSLLRTWIAWLLMLALLQVIVIGWQRWRLRTA